MDLDLVASSTRDENILMKIALRILIPVQVFLTPLIDSTPRIPQFPRHFDWHKLVSQGFNSNCHCGFSMKGCPQLHAFEQLVLSWWHCFWRLWSLWIWALIDKSGPLSISFWATPVLTWFLCFLSATEMWYSGSSFPWKK